MTDFLLDDDGDLKLDETTGDLVIGESTAQHQNLLLMTEKGQWKENPDCGVGAIRYLENEDPAGLLREVRVQFASDGMNVKQVQFDKTGKLIIDATYNSV